MDISVVICTYNRSLQLKNVLTSLQSQTVNGRLDWEIIVVDNNSTDATFDVVKEFTEASNIPLRYTKEKNQGLSYARNRGIVEAKGRYIAFIDDDAVAEPGWIISLCKTFQEFNCHCVGGKIFLKPVKKLPRWLKKELWGFLAYLDYGDKPFQVTNQYIYGTNIAFTKEVLDRMGLFNTILGRNSDIPSGGEETELIKRILTEGGKVYYQPDAKVHHIIEEYKLKKKYFRRLHYYEGLANGKSYNGLVKKEIYGVPFFIFPQFLRSIINYIKIPTVRMQMNIWWFLGFIRGRVIIYKQKTETKKNC